MILNTKISGEWYPENHIEKTIPKFEVGKAFKVKIKCLEQEFEILFDGMVSDFINQFQAISNL